MYFWHINLEQLLSFLCSPVLVIKVPGDNTFFSTLETWLFDCQSVTKTAFDYTCPASGCLYQLPAAFLASSALIGSAGHLLISKGKSATCIVHLLHKQRFRVSALLISFLSRRSWRAHLRKVFESKQHMFRQLTLSGCVSVQVLQRFYLVLYLKNSYFASVIL